MLCASLSGCVISWPERRQPLGRRSRGFGGADLSLSTISGRNRRLCEPSPEGEDGFAEDGEGAVGGAGGHDGVSGEGREIGEQALEAVDGGAVGRASRGAVGEGGRRALRLGDRARAQGLGGV